MTSESFDAINLGEKREKFSKPIRFSPLGVVCLKEIEVRVPFVPDHLNEQPKQRQNPRKLYRSENNSELQKPRALRT